MKIRNINPLGAVEDLALGRIVEAGEVVKVSAAVGAERIATGNYEPVDAPATEPTPKEG